MSLINEALRKARREEAEREDRRRGRAPARLEEGASSARFGAGLLIGAVIAVSATLVGAGAVWWAIGHSQRRPDAEEATAAALVPEAADAAAGSVGPIAAEPRLAAETPREGEPPAPSIPLAELPITVEEAPGDPADGRQEVEDAVAEPDAGGRGGDLPEGDRPLPGRQGAGGAEQVFTADAEVDGVRLSLDYIVFREQDPFAQVNGQDLRLGSEIEGFRVEEITQDFLRLRRGDRELILRVR